MRFRNLITLLIVAFLVIGCSGGSGSSSNQSTTESTEVPTIEASTNEPTAEPTVAEEPTDVPVDEPTAEAADENVETDEAETRTIDDMLGAVFSPPRQLSDYTLASTLGEDYTFSDHLGEITLLYFGYRTCPDYCPTTFGELKRVYQSIEEQNLQDKLNIVFVTVDPERDKLDDLEAYVSLFHEDFIGLYDDGDMLEKMKSEFGITVERRDIEGSDMYFLDHTVSVFMINENGNLLAQYLYGTDVRDIIHDLEIVLADL